MVARHIDFTAYDGRHARILAGGIEIGRTEETAVVGDGDAGHTQFLGFFCGIGDADSAIEQAEFGMAMQVDEI